MNVTSKVIKVRILFYSVISWPVVSNQDFPLLVKNISASRFTRIFHLLINLHNKTHPNFAQI